MTRFGSANAHWASSKETPCFFWFPRFFYAPVPLRGADGQDVAVRDRAEIRGLERNQGFGVTRRTDELHFDPLGSVELYNRTKVSGAQVVLGKVTG